MENSGGIGTYNDEAAGIYAQSIGGGGGDGGLGKALGSDGTISANIGVGGGGGAGGNGGTVSIINTGTILTEGGSSPALEAQSVGGGGGNGGDAATGAGSHPFLNMTVFLTDRLGTGLDVENKDGAAALLPVAIRTLTSFNALKNVFAAYNKLSKGGPGVSRAGTAKATLTVRVGGGFGGAGGSGGSGGFVKIQNKGSLEAAAAVRAGPPIPAQICWFPIPARWTWFWALAAAAAVSVTAVMSASPVPAGCKPRATFPTLFRRKASAAAAAMAAKPSRKTAYLVSSPLP
jgi:hypothetical protein